MKHINRTLTILSCIIITASISNSIDARSPYRMQKRGIPSITVQWHDEADPDKKYTISDAHLTEYAFFETFDKKFFYNNLLPATPITTRYEPKKKVDPHDLNVCMEHLLTEIACKNKEYTHFTILQDKDFNRRKRCGLLILKFNNYPFVLKLFIEKPKTFINPRCKGFEPVFFFYMGGGINRHLSGFTRPKNLAYVREKIEQSPEWSSQVDLPRKWFWLPKKETWIRIEGTNISGTKNICTQVPGTYGIIADLINIDQSFNMYNCADRTKSLDLCNYLDLYIDPHIQNFMYESGTKKIIIVDTEHFPTMVGLKEKESFDNYIFWYTFLMKKCAHDMLFSTPKRLRIIEKDRSELALPHY